MKKLVIAIVLAIVGVLAFAAPSFAHDKKAYVDCTTWSVSLTNYDNTATATVIVDGKTVQSGVFNGSYVKSGTFVNTYTTATHRLQVNVVSKDGTQYNYAFDQTFSGCAVPIPPKPPVKHTVTTGDWVLGEVPCGASTRTDTRIDTYTDIDYVWSGTEYVEQPPVVTTGTETRTVDVAVAACPTHTEPPAPPVKHDTPTPPDANKGEVMAETGQREDVLLGGGILFVLLTGAGVGAIIYSRRRRSA